MVLYQVWAFVAPGLYSQEKRMVLRLVNQAFAPASITAAPDIEQYFGFVLTLFFVFGSSFEVPIAVIVLATHRRGDDRTAAQVPRLLHRRADHLEEEQGA